MFINFWYAVEWSEKLTDAPVKARMLGHDFVVFRDSAGVAQCLSDTCVHRGGSLSGGKLIGDCVQCPYHGWQFDGHGVCQRIPSLGANAKVPARAKVDAYPTQEKYGIVFAFLGDLPADQRPPIMEIPEYGQPGWHATTQERRSGDDYRRQVENALDPAHNEFVHPTHGFSGSREDYHVPELELEEDQWSSGFLTKYFAPPLKDEKMKSASGRSKDAVIEAGSLHHGPTSICTKIHPTAEVFIHQHVFKTPVDELGTRTFLVQTRNFMLESEHDDRFRERNDVVAGQDADVLAELHPPLTPETNQHEFLLPSDAAVLRYREKLDEWQALGWRLDADALARTSKGVAYAIPSPARQQRPTGWVLDASPLLAATATSATATGTK
jgi:phenylpropionate dioxygenase-like ring-hydroxylating dioxygenase large terminal subunit